MSLELIAEIAIPVDSLETSSLLPHTPKEFTRLAIAFRVSGAVFVFQKPHGKLAHVLDRLHVVLDDEARNEDESIGIVVGWIHGKLTTVVEETRSTTSGGLKDFDIVLDVMNTARDRRNNTLGVVLGRLLPISHLGIVSTVEVVASHSVKVVERSDGESRAT